MKLTKSLSFAAVLTGLSAFPVSSMAEEESGVSPTEMQVTIPPLFEYVVAPEDLPDLQSRTDYLMDHFWDPFDFKGTGAVDQNALNHAFGVYVQAMAYASEKKVQSSVKELIKKIRNNPGLSYQFAKAAEENLYGPRADLWGDAIYIEFLQNAVDNKKVRESQKKHFSDHLALLKRTAVGMPFPSVEVINMEGMASRFIPTKEFTLVEITPPNCEDGPYSNLKMDISSVINDLIEEGRLEVDIFVLDDKAPQGSFPSKWNILYGGDAWKTLDIRRIPSFYVLGKNKEILGKNLHIDEAVELLESLRSE